MINIWVNYHLPEETSNFGFWGQILDQTHWLSQLLAFAFAFISAIILNTLFNRNEFMERNNFLPSLLYVSFLSFFHSFYYLDGFSVAQLFMVLALFQLFRLSQNEDGRRIVFNAGFLLGVACTFFPLLILFVPFLFWMIWVIRPFVLRESLLTIIGFIIPLIYAGVYGEIFNIKLTGAEFSSSAFEMKLQDIIILSILGFGLAILAMRTILVKIQQSSIRLKKLFRVVLILVNFSLLLTVLEYFVFHKKESLALAFIPLIFFLPYAFGYKKQRKTTTVVFYLLFLFSVSKFLLPLNLLALE